MSDVHDVGGWEWGGGVDGSEVAVKMTECKRHGSYRDQ